MTQEPEDAIRDKTSETLNKDDLVNSLQWMDSVLKKAGLNDAAKFGLLLLAVILIPDLVQFKIYRGA